MSAGSVDTYVVFVEEHLLAAGTLAIVLSASKAWLDEGKPGRMLIFRDATGQQIDFDFRGTLEDVLTRALTPQSSGRGRPKLGVQSREVSLLPEQWEWLQAQPKGMSATLRALIDAEMNQRTPLKIAHRARDAAYKFMTTIAGNRPGYEEACRALYRGDRGQFELQTEIWPAGVKAHVRQLAAPWFDIGH